MKKLLMVVVAVLHFCGLFAGEWSFNSSLGLQMTPKNKAIIVSEKGENCFAKIKKDQLQIGATIPSRRAFSSEVEDGKACVSKTTTGREWYFNGVSVVWKHNF